MGTFHVNIYLRIPQLVDIVMMAVSIYIGYWQDQAPVTGLCIGNTGLLKDKCALQTNPVMIPLLSIECQVRWVRDLYNV